MIGSALRLGGQGLQLDEMRQPWSAALAQATLSVSEQLQGTAHRCGGFVGITITDDVSRDSTMGYEAIDHRLCSPVSCSY